MDQARRLEFGKEAREYIELKLALKAAQVRLSECQDQVSMLKSKLHTSKETLHKYVGRNIPSRCTTVDGSVVTVELIDNGHLVRVFDCEGEAIS